MGFDPRVAHDGRGGRQVPKAVKEPLSPWVDNEKPVKEVRDMEKSGILRILDFPG